MYNSPQLLCGRGAISDDRNNQPDIFEYKAVYIRAKNVIDILPLPAILLYFRIFIPWSFDSTMDTYGVMTMKAAIQAKPKRTYLCYVNNEIRFAKRDFLREALFLCISPFEAILSMTETASLKACVAPSASFSATERSTRLVCDFNMPFLFRLMMVLLLVCRMAFLADFCCAMNNSCMR